MGFNQKKARKSLMLFEERHILVSQSASFTLATRFRFNPKTRMEIGIFARGKIKIYACEIRMTKNKIYLYARCVQYITGARIKRKNLERSNA